MTIFQAVVLGIIQGATEFLPISSSGHLVLFPGFFGWSLQDVTFDAVIHLATLIVVLAYFRRDIVEIVKKHRRILVTIIAATIPVGIAGLYIERIESLRSLPIVFCSLTFWGAVLICADVYADKVRAKLVSLSDIKWARVIIVGVSQAIALIPGTSRSGIAITAGLFSGIERKLATRLAFLVGIPTIALAGFVKFADVARGAIEINPAPLAAGFTAALVSGYLAVSLLVHLVDKIGFKWFGVYRVILAAVLFALWLESIRPPL
jgi:undecaprenyl-diphosphatase